VPVLSITVKPYRHLYDIAKREKADNHTRDRFRELGCQHQPVPKFYGICAIGTRFAVYAYFQKANNCVSPASIPRDLTVLNDVAPMSRWKYDLLEAEGEKMFRLIVEEVKAMVKDINDKF